MDRVSANGLHAADAMALKNVDQSSGITRLFHAITAPYSRLYNRNMLLALAIPVAAAIGLPLTMGFVVSGLTFAQYSDLLSTHAGEGLKALGEVKKRIVWECGPGLLACYVVQPDGWSWDHLGSLYTVQGLAGIENPRAHLLWLEPLMKKLA